jgi:hypothetical protein
MKNIVSTIVALLLIFAGFTSCKKDKLPPKTGTPPTQEKPSDSLDTPENCGCGDLDTVVDHPGVIYYKVSTHSYDTYENNKFWISYSPVQGFIYRWIICNEVLPSDILKLKEEGDTSLNVIFSGYVKDPCQTPASIPEHVYYDIVLTKIKVQ